MKDHTKARVAAIPNCDVCAGNGKSVPAYADARMMQGDYAGRWGYVCTQHYAQLGCRLGLGRGQELVLA